MAPTGKDSSGTIPGAGTLLDTVVPAIELVGKSLATKVAHVSGTEVETVKLDTLDEITYGFCQGLFVNKEGFK
jgi:hypothetical protein